MLHSQSTVIGLRKNRTDHFSAKLGGLYAFQSLDEAPGCVEDSSNFLVGNAYEPQRSNEDGRK